MGRERPPRPAPLPALLRKVLLHLFGQLSEALGDRLEAAVRHIDRFLCLATGGVRLQIGSDRLDRHLGIAQLVVHGFGDGDESLKTIVHVLGVRCWEPER